MLFSVEQAFVGREEIRAPLKTPAWEAIFPLDRPFSTALSEMYNIPSPAFQWEFRPSPREVLNLF